ncbi:MAG: YeeE/YedE family protein [bacterium]|nr:YeeE/YedE family protein [bacterium]
MAPFNIIAGLGKFLGYMVFLLIGVGFGAALELSGFGDSRKLAAQFYFKDMTVLKVMFTAIIVAMVLIFGFSALGFLEFERIYVNETYLLPGIIGGLIMGVGFIVGGFCPGTSIVAVSTFKIDGFFFAGGVAFGVFLFGESVSMFGGFHNSTFMGRFILPELFGVSTGIVVVGVVFMALVMFYWAEISEAFFGRKVPWKKINMMPGDGKKMLASATLVFVAFIVLFSGQPTPEDKWERIKDTEAAVLEKREVYVHPGELAGVMTDPMLYTTLLDVRSESDFNLFHLETAQRITRDDIHNNDFIKELIEAPGNTVVVVMSNSEVASTEAYKLLKGQGVLNLYILEGGINNWLNVYTPAEGIMVKGTAGTGKEKLYHTFKKAVGESIASSNPGYNPEHTHHQPAPEFIEKIKIRKKKVVAGGCG